MPLLHATNTTRYRYRLLQPRPFDSTTHTCLSYCPPLVASTIARTSPPSLVASVTHHHFPPVPLAAAQTIRHAASYRNRSPLVAPTISRTQPPSLDASVVCHHFHATHTACRTRTRSPLPKTTSFRYRPPLVATTITRTSPPSLEALLTPPPPSATSSTCGSLHNAVQPLGASSSTSSLTDGHPSQRCCNPILHTMDCSSENLPKP